MKKTYKYLTIIIIALGIITSGFNLFSAINNDITIKIPLKIISFIYFLLLYWVINPKRRFSLILINIYIALFLFKVLYQNRYGLSTNTLTDCSIIILIGLQIQTVIKYCYLPILKITNMLFIKFDLYSKSIIKYAYYYRHNNEVIELGMQLLEKNNDSYIYFYLASANYRNGNFDKSIEFYKKIQSNSKYYNQSLFFTARSYISCARYKETIDIITKYININNNDIDALYLRADANVELDNIIESINDYKTIIMINPDDGTAYYNMARLHNSIGKTNECNENLYCAINCSQPSASAFIELGNIAIEEDNLVKAEDYFEAGLELDPSLEKYIERENQ